MNCQFILLFFFYLKSGQLFKSRNRKGVLTVFICLILLGSHSYGQFVVKGVVTDTLNFVQLPFASITLFRASDSIIETFARTAGNGTFQLKVAKEGKYIIRATFPGYADRVEALNVKNEVTDAGTLPMVTKERLLKEFVLTRQIAAIKIKGDTTEYVADSFKTKDNADVEELLKKLPGIQVDKDGKITAQGETVAKILVDGEEFFSDDPKVVTKGFQAKAVDKIQVFDKKSDQAAFSGIDDGEKTKTINVELKANMKKGYFGKVDGGQGTDGYYQDQGMFNEFRDKLQLSAFGIASNTDKAGLGWGDNSKFGSGENTVIADDGSTYTTMTNSSDFAGWDGKYNGQGQPSTNTGGLHFADKWNDDKDHASANYRYGIQEVDVNCNNVTQYILPGNSGTVLREQRSQTSIGYRHGGDAMYERKIDSNTTIKVMVDGGIKHTEIYSAYNDTTFGSDNNFINKNTRTITSKADGQYLNADVILRKKFAKKGRTLTVDVKENYNQAKSIGTLNSNLIYLDTTLKEQNTLEDKVSKTDKIAFSAKAIYSEPLSKSSFLIANYSLTTNNTTALNYTYDSLNSKLADTPNSTYSSNYRFNIYTNRGGINYKYTKGKIQFSAGSDFSDTRFNQEDLFRDGQPVNRDYVNIFPSANFRYSFAKQTSLYFSYQGNTQQPTIDQIQPLVQNTDPLNITIGNPALRQSFTNRFSANYYDYKVLTYAYTSVVLTFKTVADAISTDQEIAPTGNTTQYINVNGNYSGEFRVSRRQKIKKTNLFISGNLNANLNHIHNIINGEQNVSDNNTYSIQVYLTYEKDKKYSFDYSPQFTYNDNRATISNFGNSYYLIENNVSGWYLITKKLEINSSIDFINRQRTPVFDQNNNVVRWNAYVSYKLLKNNELECRLSVFDILKQNLGYTRTTQNGVIIENTYNTIGRYGMLNVIWNFKHNPNGVAQLN